MAAKTVFMVYKVAMAYAALKCINWLTEAELVKANDQVICQIMHTYISFE